MFGFGSLGATAFCFGRRAIGSLLPSSQLAPFLILILCIFLILMYIPFIAFNCPLNVVSEFSEGLACAWHNRKHSILQQKDLAKHFHELWLLKDWMF